MRLLLLVVPAAACAAAMVRCFRMMRHDMPAHEAAGHDDVEALRKEVADLREELARARSARGDAVAAGATEPDRRSSSDVRLDGKPPRQLLAGATRTSGGPDG